MYLRFEDWSSFTSWLDARGVKHGGKIIKAYPSEDDPREKYNKSTLVVIESDDSPFTEQDLFNFGQRGTFTGIDFESAIAQRVTNDKAARVARALARFGTRDDTRFAYVAMEQIKRDGSFLIEHPLDGIHGWERVGGGRTGEEELLHLDIFTSTSLPRLRNIVDYGNPALIRTSEERYAYEREHQAVVRERGF